jgi:mono/diheme cytochrome c family protein
MIRCTLITLFMSAAAAAADMTHFEQRIRPLLLANCIDCHGPDKQKGGLRLDSRAGWQTGGDSGPAIVPGKLGASQALAGRQLHRPRFENAAEAEAQGQRNRRSQTLDRIRRAGSPR